MKRKRDEDVKLESEPEKKKQKFENVTSEVEQDRKFYLEKTKGEGKVASKVKEKAPKKKGFSKYDAWKLKRKADELKREELKLKLNTPPINCEVCKEKFASKGKNSPFFGHILKGCVQATVCNGKVSYEK